MIDPQQLHAAALAAFNRHDWSRVRALSAQLLSLVPRHGGIHYLAGIASLEQRDLPHALQHLRQATELEPLRIEFATHYARALATARLGSAAKAAAMHAMALNPTNAATLDLLGSILAESGDHAAATEAYRRAVAIAPTSPHFRFNLATTLIHTGDATNAECEIETCLAHDSLFWRAHLALSNLRRQTPATQHVPRLQALLAQHAGEREARLCLHFALAKEYEDLGEYSQAFTHYSHGNAVGRETINYAPTHDAAIFVAMERTFPEVLPAATGHPSVEPIFVFGLPRSGTTLVERILSSHPDVHTAGELQNFGMAVRRAWNSPTPFWLDPTPATRVQGLDWQRLGSDYLASTRPSTGHTPHFVDKFPFNFLYAGFIAHALPNAKIVCLRRDPMDTCLANFRQLFAEKLPYYHHSFDLLDAGRYYILFDRLMAHWRTIFPGRILELRYESLVESQQIETHRLLEHCGLRWHDACLHFERNAAPVATASSLQVRQPLFRSSIGHWRHYENELRPLHALLHAAGIVPTDLTDSPRPLHTR